jgi:hypothetical protein
MNTKSKIGAGLIGIALFDMFFIVLLALPTEIVPLAIAGAVCAVSGLTLMIYGEMK